MGWIGFAIALCVFFLAHGIPVRPKVKARIVARIGARGFTIGYSLLSVAILTWLIIAAGRAPFVELWPYAPWQKHAALTLVLIGLIILCLAIGRPNPLSFGGANNAAFDPETPGIVGWFRHPLLAAIGLWAGAHTLVNGDLAHVILFGLFTGFALIGRKIIDRRKKRQLGEDWSRLAATARKLHLTRNGLLRVLVSVLLYGALIALHAPIIGVSPLP